MSCGRPWSRKVQTAQALATTVMQLKVIGTPTFQEANRRDVGHFSDSGTIYIAALKNQTLEVAQIDSSPAVANAINTLNMHGKRRPVWVYRIERMASPLSVVKRC